MEFSVKDKNTKEWKDKVLSMHNNAYDLCKKKKKIPKMSAIPIEDRNSY